MQIGRPGERQDSGQPVECQIERAPGAVDTAGEAVKDAFQSTRLTRQDAERVVIGLTGVNDDRQIH